MIRYLRRLTSPVIVSGQDYFGRPSKLTFENYPGQNGFFLRYPGKSEPIQLTIDSLNSLKRRVAVVADGVPVLNIFEHLGSVLRFGLFDGIIISCSSAWPPYHGRPLEIYKALLENSVEIETKTQWVKTHRTTSSYGDSKNHYTAIHGMDTGGKPRLEVKVICDYKGLGKKEIDYVFPNDDSEILAYAFSAYAQGWPTWTYHLAKLCQNFGWPHFNHITWKQNQTNNEDTLELFCLHRLCDLLGTLSLVHPTKFFSGQVISVCSGHKQDVMSIREVSKYLTDFS